MTIPWPIVLSIWIPFLPVTVGLLTRSYRYPVTHLLLWWCSVCAALNTVSYFTATSGQRNHWIAHITPPVDIVLLTLTLALLVPNERVARLKGWIIGVGLAAIIALSIATETITNWPVLTGTLRSLVVSACAAGVLLLLTISAQQPFWRDGGRLIATGVILILAPNLLPELVIPILAIDGWSPLLIRLYVARAVFASLGYGALALGMLWHSKSLPSGSAFLPSHFSPSAP